MDPTKKASLKHGLAACALAAGGILLQGAARPLTAAPPAIAPIEVAPAPDLRRKALVGYLSDKYGREPELTGTIVDEAYAAGEALDVDPLLLLAVIAVESRFDPAARSGYGARGLMQVVPRYHRAKLAEHGGEPALLDPRVNVKVGTEILRDSLRKTGSVQAGLQRYAGWQEDEERRYARKVITEKERLRRIVRLAQQAANDERKPS